MSENIQDLDAPVDFVEYEVSRVGTVIDPQGEPGYRVRLPDGRVTAFPAASGQPCEQNAEADIAAAISAANSPQVQIGQFVARAKIAMQEVLDGKAREAGYDSIISACSYASDPTGVFTDEGKAFAQWRSDYWAAGFTALSTHQVGDPIPSLEDFLASLPEYIAP